MDVPLELRRLDPHAQLLPQVLSKAVDEVPRPLVAPVDQRIGARHRFNIGLAFCKFRHIRIVLPQPLGRGPQFRCKSSRMALVQIPHRCRQHHNVTRRHGVLEDDFPHRSGRQRGAKDPARDLISRVGIHERESGKLPAWMPEKLGDARGAMRR